MKLCNYYPKFEANQVLSADQLNQITVFLEKQERLTRRLFGAGIFCGFELTYTETPKITITISKGCGITTEGYLIIADKDKLTRYRPYTDPANYELFGSADSKISLWELLPAGVSKEDSSINDLTADFLDDKAVILYLEIQELDLGTCTGSDCNEKGKRMQLCVKKLLIKISDLKLIISNCLNLDVSADFKDFINARYRLPEIAIPRETALMHTTINSYSDLQKFYGILIEVSLPKVQNALKESYERFKPLLQNKFKDPFHNYSLADVYQKIIKVSPYALQYFYDFLKDLILAYNEFKDTAFDLVSSCFYNSSCFPLHLMLGEAKGYSDCEPSVYRQQFVQSPLFNGQAALYKKVLMLYERLVLMTKYFQIPETEKTGIKITPSKEKRSVLSKRSIPYYYVKQENYIIHHYWNYELKRRCKSQLNLSYNSVSYPEEIPAFVKDPLAFDRYDYPFFRIEGHLYKDCDTAFNNITEQISQYNLPFKIIKLKLGSQPDAGKVNIDCRFEDLELLYDSISTEFLCFLKNEIKFFGELDYGTATPPDASPGILKGTVKIKGGEIIPGITVTITQVGTGGKQTNVVTDMNGNFQANNLTPGTYEVKVAQAGFKQFQQQVNIDPGATLTININLEIVYNVEGNLKAKDTGYIAYADLSKTEGIGTQYYGAIMREFSTSNLAKGDFLKLSSGESFAETSVGRMYIDYTKSRTQSDIFGFIGNYLKGAKAVTDINWGILIGQYYYPLLIVKNIEDLVAVITDTLNELDINQVIEKSGTLSTNAKSFSQEIYSNLKDPKYEQTGRESEILLHLRDLIKKCTIANFKMLIDTYNKQAIEIQKLTLFSYYVKNHPGVEHKAGVYSGGTFILVSDENGNVAADFSLPFICCSDCPPITFVSATPVIFKLPKDKFCANDTAEYNFILEPSGGEVKGPGITKNQSTGGYTFNPSKVQGGDVKFTYNVNLDIYNLLVTVIDLKPSFVYTLSTPVPGKKQREVKFTASPADADSYAWDFGDGKTSTETNPTHTFNLDKSEQFEVTLKVTKGECSAETKQTLTIPYCTAVFTYNVEKVTDNIAVVQFTSEMTNADSYKWLFGDGSTSAEDNPIHSFDLSNQTSFDVSLNVKHGDCKDTTTQKITITPCTADFTFKTVKQGATKIDILFQANTPDADKYIWDFGDGSDSVNKPELNHTYVLQQQSRVVIVSLQIIKGICNSKQRKQVTLPAAEKIAISLPQTEFCKRTDQSFAFTISGGKGELTGPGVKQEGDNYYFIPADNSVQAGTVTFTYKSDNGQTASLSVRVYDPVANFSYKIQRMTISSYLITLTNLSTGANSYVWRMDGNIIQLASDSTIVLQDAKPDEQHEISLTAIYEIKSEKVAKKCSSTHQETITLLDSSYPGQGTFLGVATGGYTVYNSSTGASDATTGTAILNLDAINTLNTLPGFNSALTTNVAAYKDSKKYFTAVADDLSNANTKKLYINGSKNNEIAEQFTGLLSQTFSKITKYEGTNTAKNRQFTYNIILLQISQFLNLAAMQKSDITSDSSMVQVFKNIISGLQELKGMDVNINPDNKLSAVVKNALDNSSSKPLMQTLIKRIDSVVNG